MEWIHVSSSTGHEIIGRVVEVGNAVTTKDLGRLYRLAKPVLLASKICNFAKMVQHLLTTVQISILKAKHYGGYSTSVVVDEKFVLRIPENLDEAATAPLLCAGVTTWSPLRHWNVKKGDKVGVVGLGGLGHKGVKLLI
jgi:uncharacterized zinc-type alcohol dehydrogenase-like protein